MISVIVPIYKVEAYLYRCVDSLLAQTYQNFELILVDDGSPDGCGRICDEYALRDQRVRVIHKCNGGLSDARNAGLECAQGAYIAFVDSDDWVSPLYLEGLLRGLSAANADICDCRIIRTHTEEVFAPLMSAVPEVYDTEAALGGLICDDLFHQHVWNKLYRTEVIGNIRFPKGKLHEDEFWTYQVFGNAARVAKIPDVLYCYYQHPDSIMGATFNLRRLDALEAKAQRQIYIQSSYPGLAAAAEINLFRTCIYAGQMTLLHLNQEDQRKAQSIIDEICTGHMPSMRTCLRCGGTDKLWFGLARLHFWMLCRLKNSLRRGID